MVREAGHARQDDLDVVHDALELVLQRLPYVAEMAMYARGETKRPATLCPYACLETDCVDIADIIAWVARIQHGQRRRSEAHLYTHDQLGDLLRSGSSVLPGWEQLTNLDLRVDVQRVVDSIPRALHIPITFPIVVWRYLQGESTRDLATALGVSQTTVVHWLHRAWVHCRAALVEYREDRRLRGDPCAG